MHYPLTTLPDTKTHFRVRHRNVFPCPSSQLHQVFKCTTHRLLVPTRKHISVSNTATCFRVHPFTLHFLYFTYCQWLIFVFCICITPLSRLMMPPRKKRKSLKEDNKQKSPPKVVGMNHPVDPNPTSDGATPPKQSKEKGCLQ